MYFARIHNTSRPANKLQAQVLSMVEKYDSIILDDPEVLAVKIQELTKQANYNNRRCLSLLTRVNRKHDTNEITSIHTLNLFNLAIHKVMGQFSPKGNTATKPAATPSPAPTTEQPNTDTPRQAINKSRDNHTPATLEPWSKFAAPVQELLKQGRIWNVYFDAQDRPVAEEYGGRTHPAY